MAPKWATPQRQASLAHLVQKVLVTGEGITLDLFDGKLDIPAMEEHIRVWIALDREEREALWRAERRRLHSQPEFHKRGQYDSLTKEMLLADRPLWEIQAVGVGAFTFQRVLKVNIPGLDKTIWVNLPAPKGVSKHKRRKFFRYGKGVLPEPEADLMYRVIHEAVQRALSN